MRFDDTFVPFATYVPPDEQPEVLAEARRELRTPSTRRAPFTKLGTRTKSALGS